MEVTSNTVVFRETAFLTVIRSALFFVCGKGYLRKLYSDLQSLSTDPSTAGSGADTPSSPPREPVDTNEDIELETLPSPSTQTRKSNKALISSDSSFLHSTISRVIFSWTFSESCILFSLLIYQDVGVFSARTRLVNWQFSLLFLVANITLVIPVCASLLLALGARDIQYRRQLLGPRLLISLVPVALYLLTLSYIPLPAPLASTDFRNATLSRLIVVGTVILGLLSGFGAVSSSWQFIPFLSTTRSVPSERDIDAAKYALSSVRNDLRDRRLEIERRASTSAQGSWISRVGSSFRGDDSLTQEFKGLEALEYQMSRNLETLLETQRAARYNETLKGKLVALGGRLFAAYCIIRIINSIFNLIFLPSRRTSQTKTYPDVITQFLVYIVDLVSRNDVKYEDIVSFSRLSSLVLVGIIILSSIRLVLRGVTRAFRVTSRNLRASLMLLVLAQLMGIYLLSTLVQLRTSFSSSRFDSDGDPADTTNLFSTLPEYEAFGSLFDCSFLISAGVSIFVRWSAERMNGVLGA